MAVFHHLALNCRDVKAQGAFYARHFGFKRVRTFRAGRPDEFIILRLGNACLELFPAQEGGPGRSDQAQAVGFKHLAFEVDDLDRTVGELKADGVQPEAIMDLSAMAEGLRICFFNDPEGNRIEIMEGYQDE